MCKRECLLRCVAVCCMCCSAGEKVYARGRVSVCVCERERQETVIEKAQGTERVQKRVFVAVCRSVLQCVAVCGSVLQCVAVCCSMMQYLAVCCSMLQCVAVCDVRS